MLVLSPLRDIKDERQIEMESFSIGGDEFPDFSEGNLLDSIDFDDLFVGINDGDLLPDLEMDTEILAEFSLGGGEESEMSITSISGEKVESSNSSTKEEVDKTSSASEFGCSNQRVEDDVSKPNEYVELDGNLPNKESDKGKKSSSKQSKHPLGKRKFKVDWTPELHRRFVQAVEQLGVDKAVPSRILELMGIDCLTRHNIASHLQKYRSHRKHLLAKEVEAASWNQKRQMYGGAAMSNGGKRDLNRWVAPTIGFPPMAPPMSHVRPLHVWGHPSVDQSMLMQVWPKHLAPSISPLPPPPPGAWIPHSPPTPPAHPSFWQGYHQHAPNSLTTGSPCFGPPMTSGRFSNPLLHSIPPRKLYKVDRGVGVPTSTLVQTLPKLALDFQPSKESIDAAIGDVLSKPSVPLPLRLKPPSVDSVLVELQRQGVSKLPPSSMCLYNNPESFNSTKFPALRLPRPI